MVQDVQNALAGFNLASHPGRCAAVCSTHPESKEHDGLKISSTNIPISSSMITLGHLLAFRRASHHYFEHRKISAWKVAHANTTLLRSKVVSRKQRTRLLYSLIRPCIMHAGEAWKWSPELLAQILTAEREFGRWCLRLSSFFREGNWMRTALNPCKNSLRGKRTQQEKSLCTAPKQDLNGGTGVPSNPTWAGQVMPLV